MGTDNRLRCIQFGGETIWKEKFEDLGVDGRII
jgi:hypothetical protein